MLYNKKNGNIEITVESKGAELKALLKDGKDFMWNADAKYWAKTSPVLFPFVGGCKEGKYTYKGIEYPMGRHGFARDNEFELVESGENNLKFSYKSNEESLKVYPFNFEFIINYVITADGVNLEYEVFNKEDGEMYFNLGTHPAFMASEFPVTDYYLEFSEPETLDLYTLVGLTVAKETKPFLKNEKVIKITESICIAMIPEVSICAIVCTVNQRRQKFEYQKLYLCRTDETATCNFWARVVAMVRLAPFMCN